MAGSGVTVLGVLAYALVAVLATWFVLRTFYRTEHGTRPFLAAGCASAVMAAFLLGGFYLMMLAAIGGSFGL